MQPIDRRLTTLQWQLNIATVVLSCVAIGLYFAEQRLLAQLCLGLVGLGFLGTIAVAVLRYNRNKVRRDQILGQYEKEQNVQLRELFDEARRHQNLPPDAADQNGFNASVQAGQARIDALEKKRKNNERKDQSGGSK